MTAKELQQFKVAMKNDKLNKIKLLDFWENWKTSDIKYEEVLVKAKIKLIESSKNKRKAILELYQDDGGYLFGTIAMLGEFKDIDEIVSLIRIEIDLAFNTIGMASTCFEKRIVYDFSQLIIQLHEIDKINNRKKAVSKRSKFVYNGGYCPNSKTYIMKDKSNGLYKIGKSIKPKIREKTLQGEKPTIEIVKIFNSDIERDLHKRYVRQRVRGEWFKLTPIQVKYICTHY